MPIFIFMGNNLESNLNMFLFLALTLSPNLKNFIPEPQALITLPVCDSKALIILSTLWLSLKR